MWFHRKVIRGTQLGKKIGFPTLNFHVGDFGGRYADGVYACDIQIADRLCRGALYYGPRLNHPKKVLEVHVLNFSKEVYGQFVRFRVGKKIRKPQPFSDIEALKKQIAEDVEKCN